MFPPGPGQVALKVVRNVTYWVHRDWWKFGACDRSGTLQPLYATGAGNGVGVAEDVLRVEKGDVKDKVLL